MKDYMTQTESHQALNILDFVLLCILTMLDMLMIYTCPNKKQELRNLYLLLQCAGINVQWLPVTVMALVPSTSVPHWFKKSRTLMYGLKVGRVLPLFSLLRPFRSMQILGKALLDSRRELLLLVILLVVNSGFFGYLVYIFEIDTECSHFQSIPDGIWWGVVTMTTVGYGDLYPQSYLGRLAGILCAIVGILVIAMPIPIIAGNFSRIYELVEVAEYQRSISK